MDTYAFGLTSILLFSHYFCCDNKGMSQFVTPNKELSVKKGKIYKQLLNVLAAVLVSHSTEKMQYVFFSIQFNNR